MPRSDPRPRWAAITLSIAAFLGGSAAATADGPKPPGADAEAQLQSLRAEWRKVAEDFSKREQAATTEDAQKKVQEELHAAVGQFARRFVELAENHPKTPAAVKSLVWVIRVGRGPSDADLEKALRILARDHAAAPELVAEPIILGRLSYSASPQAEALFRAVRDNNPDKAAQASASLALGRYHKNQNRPREAEAAYAEVVARYPDTHAAAKAKGELFDLKGNLAVGKAAPEIEGEDIGGVKFKLSDYRGKVVVLDFWGHW
jgi:hypothetical protein